MFFCKTICFQTNTTTDTSRSSINKPDTCKISLSDILDYLIKGHIPLIAIKFDFTIKKIRFTFYIIPQSCINQMKTLSRENVKEINVDMVVGSLATLIVLEVKFHFYKFCPHLKQLKTPLLSDLFM